MPYSRLYCIINIDLWLGCKELNLVSLAPMASALTLSYIPITPLKKQKTPVVLLDPPGFYFFFFLGNAYLPQ